MTLTALDLFCGAGGISIGLLANGFDVVGAVDAWEPAVKTYGANFPNHRVFQADVRSINRQFMEAHGLPGQVDLIAGGPPCQGFSIQRIGEDQDDRNDLVLAFGRVVADIKPKMFLMENVPGLLGRRGKHIATRVTQELERQGYDLRSTVLDAAAFGVAQTRRRVFFVGWLREAVRDFHFPRPLLPQDQYRTVQQAIGDLPSPPQDFSPAPGDLLHRRMRLAPQNLERLKHIPPGGGFEDLPRALRVNCHKNGADRIGHRYVYGRLDGNRPAGTITARFDSFTRGRFAHPSEDRNITLREGARLQGFSDDHAFFGTQEEIAALIGNAVPPPVATALGAALRLSLEGRTPQQSGEQMALALDRAHRATVAA